MTLYSIQGPDGKTYSINGPEGATREQVIAKIKEKQQTSAAPSESGFADFFKSIPRGALGGLTEAASASGNAAQIEMGQTENPVPSGPETTELIEQNVTGPLHKPSGTAGKFGERIGEFLGSPTSYLGPGGPLVKTAGAIGAAVGSEAGGEFTEGTAAEPYARIAGGALGGGAVGKVAKEIGAAQLSATLPTKDAIKASAKAAYDMVAQARLKVAQPAVDQLATDLKTSLDDKLIVESVAPRTFKAIDQMQNAGGDIAQLMGIRQRLGKIPPSAGTDYEAAGEMKTAIDNFVENLTPQNVIAGDPQATQALLNHARSSWRAYKKLDEIEQAGEVALHRSQATGTGANYINAVRQEIRKILDSSTRSRGYSPEAKEQMEKIVLGTWATNSSRYVGKYAPSGPVSATTSILGGMAAGPEVGAAIAGTGLIAKYLGGYLTARQIRELEDIIRAESPLGQAGAAQRAAKSSQLQALPAASALRGGGTAAVASPLASPLQ